MKIAMIIGKFSPIHADHVRSIKGMIDWAEDNNFTARVYSTTSKNADEQPLDFEDKMQFVKRALEGENVEVWDKPVKGAWDAIETSVYEVFNSDGEKGVAVFTGSDHLDEYGPVIDNIIKRYEKKDRTIDFPIEVIPTVGRVNGVGISATQLRNAAKNGDVDEFMKYSPFFIEDDGLEMYIAYNDAYKEMKSEKLTESKKLLSDAWKLGEELIDMLKSEGPPGTKAYYIGGTARDWVAGNDCKDMDIATNLTKNQILDIVDPESVVSANRFGAGYIVIINYKGQKFDIDSIVEHDILEKIKTGDLTFNCMAVDPTIGKVVDPEGGRSDLEAETLRFSDYVFDCLKGNKEARSVLRPFKFQSRWGWDFDEDTINAIKVWVSEGKRFDRVQPNNMQKIVDEIKSGPHADKTVANLKELGLYDILMQYNEKKGVRLFEHILSPIRGLHITANEQRLITKWHFQNKTWDEIKDLCRSKFGKDVSYSRLEHIVAKNEDNLKENDLIENRLFESVLKDNAVFYDMIQSELDGAEHVTIYSDEPLGSNFSCFDFRQEGDDRDKSDVAGSDNRFMWKDCKITMDDDGCYFESKSGKIGAFCNYAVVKAELMPKHVRVWVSPKDSCTEMGVLDFYTPEEGLREAAILNAKTAYEATLKILEKIKEVGNRGYIVGGAVRDMITGKECNDYDILTDMSKRFLADKVGAVKSSFWRNGNEVIIVEVDGEDFEVKRLNRSQTVEDELGLRDITINSIAYDPIDDEYIDPTGGKQDAEQGVIRFTPFTEDAVKSGQQPMRVLRAVRFFATTGFELAPETYTALQQFAKKTKGNFGIQSEEGFKNNWDKLKRGKNADEAIELMKDLGLYDYCTEKFPGTMGLA